MVSAYTGLAEGDTDRTRSICVQLSKQLDTDIVLYQIFWVHLSNLTGMLYVRDYLVDGAINAVHVNKLRALSKLLWGSLLRESSLRGSSLRGSSLRGSSFRGSSLRGSSLKGSLLRLAVIYLCDVWLTTVVRVVTINHINF